MTKRVGWIICKNILLAALALFIFLTALFFFLQARGVDLSTFYGPLPSTWSPPHHPVPGQSVSLFVFWRNFLTGNLGHSFSLYPRPVWSVVAERLPRSLFLFTVALLLAIPLGKGLSRLFQSRWGGNGNRFIAIGVYALFLPWLVLLLVWIFAYKLGLLPIGKFLNPYIWRPYREISANAVFWRVVLSTFIGFAVAGLGWLGLRRFWRTVSPKWLATLLTIGMNAVLFSLGFFISIILYGKPLSSLAGDIIWHMVLPLILLTVEMSVLYALIIRSDLFRFRPFRKGSFAPFFALFLALSFAALLSVETVYSWPGVGLTLLSAILSKDMPLAIGAFIYIVVALIFFNMAMAIYRRLGDLLCKPDAVQQAKPVEPEAEPRRRARWPLVIAVALLLAFVGMVIAHPVLMSNVWDPAIYNPVTGYQPPNEEQLAQGINNPMPPSPRHLLGTDPWGRDILSQILYSARSAFAFGGLAGLIATLLGLGAALLVRTLEKARTGPLGNGLLALGCALLALPLLPLFIFVSSLVKLNLYTFALWLGLLTWPLALFILRGRPELLGSTGRIGLLKMLSAAFLYIMAISVGIEAALSFYGLLGIQMSWGIMGELANISGYLVGSAITHYWWLFWPASLMLSLFGFTTYLLGWELKARV